MMGLLAAAALSAAQTAPSADPLTAEIETADADRFAALFERTGGRPTAKQLQREYLDPGSIGVRIFTPHRIRDAAHLAATVARRRKLYEKAIRTCLPIVKTTTAELRATYLAFRGLLPERALPRIYLVVGADNSGGTAAPGAQVLGLETLCRIADTPDRLRDLLRSFYAHETVHALQRESDGPVRDPLLHAVLQEGAADLIAGLVTGRQADAARDAWAAPREADLWRQLEADLMTTRDVTPERLERGTPAGDAYYRWVGNHGSAPPGWPGELGYWMGERIWRRWYARQADKAAAIRTMLDMRDPQAVLSEGRLPTAR